MYKNPNLNFYKSYTFYYDETNNVRKFSLKNKHFNEKIHKNFILGGLVFDESKTNELALVKKIQEQFYRNHLSQELKVNDFCNKKYSFLNAVKKINTRKLFKTLIENNVYIHYNYHNNLFYALADIIDSIDDKGIFDEVDNLKEFLYNQASYNLVGMTNLLVEFDYPNVGKRSLEFYLKLIELITQNLISIIDIPSSSEKNDLIIEGLNLICFLSRFTDKEALYLSNNDSMVESERNRLVLIDEYYLIYLNKALDFKNSIHIFDEEKTVEKRIEEVKLHFCEEEIKRIEKIQFIDSKDNVLIQISDVIVGILGKFFEMVHDTPFDELKLQIEQLEGTEKEGFKMFQEIMNYSVKENEAFRNQTRNHGFQNNVQEILNYKLEV